MKTKYKTLVCLVVFPTICFKKKGKALTPPLPAPVHTVNQALNPSPSSPCSFSKDSKKTANDASPPAIIGIESTTDSYLRPGNGYKKVEKGSNQSSMQTVQAGSKQAKTMHSIENQTVKNLTIYAITQLLAYSNCFAKPCSIQAGDITGKISNLFSASKIDILEIQATFLNFIKRYDILLVLEVTDPARKTKQHIRWHLSKENLTTESITAFLNAITETYGQCTQEANTTQGYNNNLSIDLTIHIKHKTDPPLQQKLDGFIPYFNPSTEESTSIGMIYETLQKVINYEQMCVVCIQPQQQQVQEKTAFLSINGNDQVIRQKIQNLIDRNKYRTDRLNDIRNDLDQTKYELLLLNEQLDNLIKKADAHNANMKQCTKDLNAITQSFNRYQGSTLPMHETLRLSNKHLPLA